MDRLLGFEQTIQETKQLSEIPRVQQEKNFIEIKHLKIRLPNNEILINDLSFFLHQGDRLLIQGKSGSGKTTILRAINGLWPYTTGEVHYNPQLTSLFIPQKPYLPRANLKEVICYPISKNLPKDDIIAQILIECGLLHLKNKLHEISDWSQSLSLGEQQKLAFCRIIINKPDILYLDEVTSALDEDSEKCLYAKIIELLPKSIIISIGHLSTLLAFHTKVINISMKKIQA